MVKITDICQFLSHFINRTAGGLAAESRQGLG
jgi:hypothetical protein